MPYSTERLLSHYIRVSSIDMLAASSVTFVSQDLPLAHAMSGLTHDFFFCVYMPSRAEAGSRRHITDGKQMPMLPQTIRSRRDKRNGIRRHVLRIPDKVLTGDIRACPKSKIGGNQSDS